MLLVLAALPSGDLFHASLFAFLFSEAFVEACLAAGGNRLFLLEKIVSQSPVRIAIWKGLQLRDYIHCSACQSPYGRFISGALTGIRGETCYTQCAFLSGEVSADFVLFIQLDGAWSYLHD